MFSYFENRKTTLFYVLCLNLSIEKKIKTLFLISHFNLSKKRNGTLGTWILSNRKRKTLPQGKPHIAIVCIIHDCYFYIRSLYGFILEFKQ